MAAEYQPRDFAAFTSELNGDSRDRPLRLAIENKIRALFEDIDDGNWGDVREYFDKDARVIRGLYRPGLIIDRDLDEIMCWLRYHRGRARQVTVPTQVVVDRGRVTCNLTKVRADRCYDDGSIDFDTFTEYYEVIVLDLNDELRIQRFERRAHDLGERIHKGGVEAFEDLVDDARRKTVKMQEYFYQG